MICTMIEVESEVPISEQVTSVPFSASVVASTVSLETTGMLFAAELLENMNVVELICKRASSSIGFKLVTANEYLLVTVSFSGMR